MRNVERDDRSTCSPGKDRTSFVVGIVNPTTDHMSFLIYLQTISLIAHYL